MRNVIFCFILLSGINLSGQTCQQEKVEINYSNGKEVFNICKSNPTISYDEEKSYYWYTEFSKIKSTKGSSGGLLLDGNYKFYDEYGNLRVEKNYSLGLESGKTILWDSLGNIIAKSTYYKGERIYWKFQNDEDYWIEFNGQIFKEGTIRKVYTKYGTLIEEDHMLEGLKQHITTYYEYSEGQIKEDYTTTGLGGDYLYGKYITYYNNGQVKVEGMFNESNLTNIRVGKWRWYNADGTLEAESEYKAEEEYWSNGELKVIGGYIRESETGEWLKIGEWRWLDEEGSYLDIKEYKWGVEVNN